MGYRETFKAVYRLLMAAITLGFLLAAAFAFFHATPGNGLLLVAGLLFVIAILIGLSINRYDEADHRLAQAMEDMNQLRAQAPLRFALGEELLRGARTVQYTVAEPEIHSLDTERFEQVKQLAKKGASIDEICKLIDPAFDHRDPLYQDAVRGLAKSLIDADRPSRQP